MRRSDTSIDDDNNFPSADRAIDQTLSSGRTRLARLAYRSPPPPLQTDVAQLLPRQPQSSTTRGDPKPQKRARGLSTESAPRAEANQERRTSDEFDDLLDFDLGSGETRSDEKAPAEPLFLPATPTTSTPERQPGGVETSIIDNSVDNLLVDGRLDLDRLFDFGDRASDAAVTRSSDEALAPARKKARPDARPDWTFPQRSSAGAS